MTQLGPHGKIANIRCRICGSRLRRLRLPAQAGLQMACTNPACLEMHDAELRPTGRKLPRILAA